MFPSIEKLQKLGFEGRTTEDPPAPLRLVYRYPFLQVECLALGRSESSAIVLRIDSGKEVPNFNNEVQF